MRRRLVTLASAVVVLAGTVVVSNGAAGAPASKPVSPPGRGTLLVGAASRSVLPLVDGSLDYLTAGFPDRDDAFDPGIVVPEWDDGRIAVGNGDDESYWVHDDLRVTAMAVDDPHSAEIVVLVTTDLYMVFRIDAEAIRARALAQLPPGIAARTRILVTASHNHHGPDTAFDVNHDWYEHMADEAADAVVAAVTSRRPARLVAVAGEHWFGMNDGTDPQILDPRLNVLQAVDTRGGVIATAVQWNNHPEGTLGWEPPAAEIADDCVELGLTGTNCMAEGRYITADYPGVLREDLQARYGGEVLYFNGALGVLIGPGGAHVWEVDDDHPLGNQLVAPAGATAAGGGTDYTARNFRRTAVVGEQLALAAGRLLDQAVPITVPRVSYRVEPFFTYLSNFGFRVLLVVDPETGRTQLGHAPATLYTCSGEVSESTCSPDDFAAAIDPALDVPFRVGDHLRSAVEYVRIGTVGMMFLPAEIAGELTIGLPATFYSEPEHWYEEPLGTHAFGTEYETPGFVTQRMGDRFEWTIGLGSDELGYTIPISNFRVKCVAGDAACAFLYSVGAIEFPDAVAGTTCKAITEDPSLLEEYGNVDVAAAVAGSCRYGQALGEANGHYEETNSAGWDLVEDMMAAIARITGNPDATSVNPLFPGWTQGHLPPGDLP